MRVDADERKPFRARDLARLGERFAGADGRAELAVDRPRDEVRVRIHLDAGRDAEPHGLRAAPAVCEPGEPLDVVRAVDNEAPDARLEGRGDLVVGLGVAVQLHPGHPKAGAPRGLELTQRGNARVDALTRDERTDADEGARLHRISDPHRPIAEERVDVLAEALADRLGVVHVEGRAVFVGERREVVRADLDVPIAANGRPEGPDPGLDHAVRSSVAGRRAAIR